MKFQLPNAVTSRFARQTLVAKKHSPQILFYGGLVLMGATVVSSSKATLKLGDVLEEIKSDRDDVARAAEAKPEKYSDRDVQKLNYYITAKGLVSVVKLYLPAVTLGVAAVACLTTSHNQLNRRNAGLSAALAATERALDRYRNRVREAYGEERERELWRDEKTTEVPVFDDEGRETKSKTKVRTGGGVSPYARIWGRDTTTEWSPIPEYNLAKLRSVQEYCTLRLQSKGHLFLNEVFDELGLERMDYGQVVGWLKNGDGDGYVDFGILQQGEEVRFLDFMTGDEDHILLDFNVDGEVWRKI